MGREKRFFKVLCGKMLVQCKIFCSGIFSLAIINSAFGFKHGLFRGLTHKDAANLNPIRIYLDRSINPEKWDANYENSSLQKRDMLKDGMLIGALVFSNLNNMETAVNALTNIYLNFRGIKRNGDLPNGGKYSADRKSITWKGEILEFNHESLHVFVISPNVPITIEVKGKRVFLVSPSKKYSTLCQNIHNLKEVETKHRMGPNGSLWYTNLERVGNEMTSKQIKYFEEVQEKIEEEKAVAVNGVAAQAQKTFERTRRLTRSITFAADAHRKTVFEAGKFFIDELLESSKKYLGSETPSDSDEEYRMKEYLNNPLSDSDTESFMSCLERCARIWSGNTYIWDRWFSKARSTISRSRSRVSRTASQSSLRRYLSTPLSYTSSYRNRDP